MDVASQSRELAAQQRFFAAVRRNQHAPTQYTKSDIAQKNTTQGSQELSKRARPTAKASEKQIAASAAAAAFKKRKREDYCDFYDNEFEAAYQLQLKHKKMKISSEKLKASKPPRCGGMPLKNTMARDLRTSLTPFPAQLNREIAAFKASIEAVEKSKNPHAAAMQLYDASNLAGSTLVASSNDAATPTFENGDMPVYNTSMSRQSSSQGITAAVEIFIAARRLSPSSPVVEEVDEMEVELLGAHWATEPCTGVKYLKVSNHDAFEQVAYVEPMRTNKHGPSVSLLPLPLPPSKPATADEKHFHHYGVHLDDPNAHWYKSSNEHGCFHGPERLCTMSHVEFTRKTLWQKAQEEKKEKKLVAPTREDEMVARGMADVQSSGGKRQRKMTRRARGE
jgi:hypothetical protein